MTRDGTRPTSVDRACARSDFPRLVAALVRTGLAGDDEIDVIRAAAD